MITAFKVVKVDGNRYVSATAVLDIDVELWGCVEYKLGEWVKAKEAPCRSLFVFETEEPAREYMAASFYNTNRPFKLFKCEVDSITSTIPPFASHPVPHSRFANRVKLLEEIR